ncbi:MAG: hypothetical protein R3F19_19020 [Verrucomicrobiales bacterium]
MNNYLEDYVERALKTHEVLWCVDGMSRRIAHLAKALSHSHEQVKWLEGLDYDSDICNLEKWFVKFWRHGSKTRVRGLWFGMFTPVVNNKPAYDLHCQAATSFQLNDVFCDWAQDIVDESLLARSEILDQFYQFDGEVSDGKFDTEFLALGYGMMAIDAIFKSVGKELFGEQSVGLALGWDAGSPVYFGSIEKGEWRLMSRSEVTDGQGLMARTFMARYP